MGSTERTINGSENRKQSIVKIYNPLHLVLGNFTERLIEVLDHQGIASIELPSRNGEVHGSKSAKAISFASHLRRARHYAGDPGPNIVTWPLLGWWEMPLWRHSRNKTFVIMHDPEPLIYQNGLSARAAEISSKLIGPDWPHMVTMSPEAYEVASKYFDSDRIHLLSLPMRSPQFYETMQTGRRVLVLGQYKPARDLDVMATIAPELRAQGWEPTVVGRGWPEIPGWDVVNRFLTESEFHNMLISSAVVLLPYRRYFQSGVAIRALEAGVPVVGRQTGFMTSIFGNNFSGSIENWDTPSDWINAIAAANFARADQMKAARDYSTKGATEWATLLQ